MWFQCRERPRLNCVEWLQPLFQFQGSLSQGNMRDDEELRMSEMLHEHLNRYGCLPSDDDSDPFWHYCQKLFATRFSFRQLKTKIFSFHRQQTHIMESCKLTAGSSTVNSKDRNVLTISSPLPEEAMLPQINPDLVSKVNQQNHAVIGLHADPDQGFIKSVDSASPLPSSQNPTEDDKIMNSRNVGVIDSPSQAPVEVGTIWGNDSGSKLASKGHNSEPQYLALSLECNNWPVAHHLEPDEEEKALDPTEEMNPPNPHHVSESLLNLSAAQESLSSSTSMDVCKQSNGNFQSMTLSLAEVCHENANTYGDGAELKLRDTATLNHNVSKGKVLDTASSLEAPDAKSRCLLACSDESPPDLRLNLCGKRCADIVVDKLEVKHQIKMLRKSAMMDLAQAMVILSQCSLPSQ